MDSDYWIAAPPLSRNVTAIDHNFYILRKIWDQGHVRVLKTSVDAQFKDLDAKHALGTCMSHILASKAIYHAVSMEERLGTSLLYVAFKPDCRQHTVLEISDMLKHEQTPSPITEMITDLMQQPGNAHKARLDRLNQMLQVTESKVYLRDWQSWDRAQLGDCLHFLGVDRRAGRTNGKTQETDDQPRVDGQPGIGDPFPKSSGEE